jgi:beta-glucosidase
VVDRVAERLRLLASRTDESRKTRPIIDFDAHQIARRAAAESAVLLHDDRTLLPIDLAAVGSMAVIGEAVALAQSNELVVLFLGLPPSYEAEGRDRTTIELPADQVALVKAVAAVNPRVIVALSNGSAVSTADWRDTVGSIVEFWLTGQAHGDSIVDVLLRDVNPSGKLPETVPVRLEDTSAYLDFPGDVGHVRHSEGIHVGYRWFDARHLEVDYPFGHGLSYTTFVGYTDLHISVHDLDDPTAFTVSVTLTNTGSREGIEVVQVYVGDRSGSCRCLSENSEPSPKFT